MQAIIDGLMLGDGGISMHGKIGARMSVGRQIAHKDYNKWIMKNTPQLAWGKEWEHLSRSYIDGREIKGNQHRIRTKNSQYLASEYARWYPNKKQIPSDLELTPMSLAVWFMDDGSLHVGSNPKGKPTSKINLYSNSFTWEENELLKEQLMGLGIKSSIQPNRGTPVLVISGMLGVRQFVDYVESTVAEVPCMSYKLEPFLSL